jgi:hypothetical protein
MTTTTTYVFRVNDPEIRQLALDLGGTPSRSMQGGIEFDLRENARLVTIAMQQKAASSRRRGVEDAQYRAALDRLLSQFTGKANATL